MAILFPDWLVCPGLILHLPHSVFLLVGVILFCFLIGWRVSGGLQPAGEEAGGGEAGRWEGEERGGGGGRG